MSVKLNDEKYYSMSEISSILQTSPEEIISFIIDFKYPLVEIQGSKHLPRSILEKFFEEYCTVKNLGKERFYKIPSYLKNCHLPWTSTLIKMYEKRFSFPGSVSPEQGELLKAIILNINPKNVVEIGCYTGISTIWMASGLQQIGSNGIIHSIDVFYERLPKLPRVYGCLLDPFQYAKEHVVEAKLSDYIKFYKIDSAVALKTYPEITFSPIDFLFIDGDHTEKGCFNDWSVYSPFVQIGGYIMFHDIYPDKCGWSGPRYVIDKYIKKNSHYELLEIKTNPRNYGMALIRRIK